MIYVGAGVRVTLLKRHMRTQIFHPQQHQFEVVKNHPSLMELTLRCTPFETACLVAGAIATTGVLVVGGAIFRHSLRQGEARPGARGGK